MRCLLLLLFLAPLARADERFDSNLQAFASVKGLLTTSGAKARIFAAVEALIEGGDARAVGPLARYLLDTFVSEAGVRDELRAEQKRGAEARDAIMVVDKEVAYMRRKLDAGDRSVAPQIQKRLEKKDAAMRVFEGVLSKTKSMNRVLAFQVELRGKLAQGVATIVGGLEGKALNATLAELRTIFDVAKIEQALLLVGIMRDSNQLACASHLVDVIDHPKADDAVRRFAVVALGRLRSPEVYRSLLTIGSRREKLRENVLHSLSLAAEQRLPDLDAAKAWVAKQKKEG